MVQKTDIDEMRKSNRPAADVVDGLVTRIENMNNDILKKRMENMASMKPLYADRGEIYKEAKEQGIHTKALKKLVSARAALRKLITAAENMDDTTADEYSHMADQLNLFGEVPGTEDLINKAKADADKDIKALNEKIKVLEAEIEELTSDSDVKVDAAAATDTVDEETAAVH